MTAPCFRCGCARTCEHREVAPPVDVALVPERVDQRAFGMGKRVRISGGGAYRRSLRRAK